ncbi:hypothetical protein A6302_04438 [Methylobrevis pamukkalensis]|uniref:Uncharacterized protein n=1 Tax=Methylobrevis pamukkalensis TaxID=1439726 RepID=A0A1E3GR47_9HYPH|nr:hypothetical protein A6302_04438 [Methylobrevis pamukkalensis]
MGRRFDERPVHRRNTPFRLRLDLGERGSETRHIDIDAGEIRAVDIGAERVVGCQSERIEPARWGEHQNPRPRKPDRPWTPVTMQPADALEQHVHRAEIGDENVGTKVKRLLQRLGADDDAPAGRAVLADGRLHRRVKACAILGRKAAVVQSRNAADREQQARFCCKAGSMSFLSTGHRVANDQHPRTPARGFDGMARGICARPAGKRLDLNRLACLCIRFHGLNASAGPDGRIGDGGLGGEIGDRLPEPADPSRGAERCRHQHHMPSEREMGLHHRGLDFSHVRIGGVHLIDHQQRAAQRHAAQMRIFHLQAAEGDLIHRSDRNP